jgi:hypothetical protein
VWIAITNSTTEKTGPLREEEASAMSFMISLGAVRYLARSPAGNTSDKLAFWTRRRGFHPAECIG